MGAASPAYAFVNVPYAPKYQKVIVEVTLPVCFNHARARSETNTTAILDPDFGTWLNPFTRQEKEGGGGIPIRDQEYRLVNDDVTLITGIAGKIPGMNVVIRLNKNNDGTYEDQLATRWAKAQQARALSKAKKIEAMNARIALEAKVRTINKEA